MHSVDLAILAEAGTNTPALQTKYIVAVSDSYITRSMPACSDHIHVLVPNALSLRNDLNRPHYHTAIIMVRDYKLVTVSPSRSIQFVQVYY